MAWVWSDELADSLRKSPDLARLIPPSWSAQPSAFAIAETEDAEVAVRRLLGVEADAGVAVEMDDEPCTCGRANPAT